MLLRRTAHRSSTSQLHEARIAACEYVSSSAVGGSSAVRPCPPKRSIVTLIGLSRSSSGMIASELVAVIATRADYRQLLAEGGRSAKTRTG